MERGIATATSRKPKPDDATLLALAEAGKPSRQIETILGNIDHATVCRRLKHLTPRKSTEIYKTVRADVLAEMQRKLLMACDANEVKTNPRAVRDRVVSAGILFDKERLERDLSTQNLSSRMSVKMLGSEEKGRLDKALESMYGQAPANAKVEGDPTDV